MKIAICLSGMPRHFEECFESIKENIILISRHIQT